MPVMLDVSSGLPDCQITPTDTGVQVTGIGLITGQGITVTVNPAPAGTGIVFTNPLGQTIPAQLSHVVHTDRGVTLASAPTAEYPKPWTLSIVEHFLAATAMAGFSDLQVQVANAHDPSQAAPELPLLDGSAANWLDALASLPQPLPQAPIALQHAVFYRHSPDICLYAVPAPSFRVTYAIDFNHPDLRNAFITWDLAQDGVGAIAPAQTYGYLHELPTLQAQGLARGVRESNTLGILSPDDPTYPQFSGYTRPLRLPQEPLCHKILDLIGDLSLMRSNPLRLQAHIIAINAGHGSHVRFSHRLRLTSY